MRIVGYIFGGLIVALGLPPLLVGLALALKVGDGSGIDIPLKGFTAPPRAVAVVSPELSMNLKDVPAQVADASVAVHIVPPAGSGPLFVGVASSQDVKRYLRGAPIATIEPVDQQGRSLGGDNGGNGGGGKSGGNGSGGSGGGATPDPQAILTDGLPVRLVLEPGRRAKVMPPGRKAFWLKTVQPADDGTLSLSARELSGRNVRIVIMRVDGKPGIAAAVAVRLHLPILRTAGLIILATGVVLVALGVLLIVLIARRGRRARAAAAGTAATAATDDADVPAEDAPAEDAPAPVEETAAPSDDAAAPAVDTQPAAPDGTADGDGSPADGPTA